MQEVEYFLTQLQIAACACAQGPSKLHPWWNIAHEYPRREESRQHSQAAAVTAATGNKRRENKSVQVSCECTQAHFIGGGALSGYVARVLSRWLLDSEAFPHQSYSQKGMEMMPR